MTTRNYDYINLSLAICMYIYIASGGVEPLQRFAVDSFIMFNMSNRVRTISGPAKYYHPLHVRIWKVLGSKYNVR